MSYASRVTYTGDSVTKTFNVPMPYLSISHIRVYVNKIMQLNPMHYTWSGPSTIQFATAPGIDDAIEIVRWTSPTAALVDFQDGSVLRAQELDTAYLHTLYLSQEYADSYNAAINNILLELATDRGIVEIETDAVIDALVQEMLSEDAAANLQQRITDIDLNAEAIVTLEENLQVQINTLAQGTAATVYVQPEPPVPGVGGIPNPIPDNARWYDSDDNNAPYIWDSVALEWLSLEDPRIGAADANIDILKADMESAHSAIVNEGFVRSTENSAFSQALSLVGAQTADGQAFVINLDTAKVSPTESLAERFTSLSASDSQNSAEITNEQIARTSAARPTSSLSMVWT
jgi:hypothetical protein